MKKSPVTQEDIARKLKVSRITVSKALRDHPDISVSMKARVIKAAEKMGYSPNLVAANLSQRKTNTIGVVIPDLENSFFAYLVDSIIDKAAERGYQIILTVSREKADIENQNIRNLLGMRVDGLLVCISQLTSDHHVFENVGRMGIPLVFFDRTIKNLGCSYVAFDDKKGTEEALNQVIADGFTRIGHFAGYSGISIGRERCNSYKNILKKNGISIRNEWIIEGGYETDDGYRAFGRLNSTGHLPEIILAVNDRVALGAYNAIRQAGLRIPEDIGIIGYGFSETAQLFNPALSVINQDPRKMGEIAANTVIDEIESVRAAGSSKIHIAEDFRWNESVRRSN